MKSPVGFTAYRGFFMSFFQLWLQDTFAAWDHMENDWLWRRTGTAGEARLTGWLENGIRWMSSLKAIPV